MLNFGDEPIRGMQANSIIVDESSSINAEQYLDKFPLPDVFWQKHRYHCTYCNKEDGYFSLELPKLSRDGANRSINWCVNCGECTLCDDSGEDD